MAYKVGLKLLKRLCLEQKPLAWHRAKLNDALFKGADEKAAFAWVANHIGKYHALPNVETLIANFSEFAQFDVPEPSKYYVDLVEKRFALELIDSANQESQSLLNPGLGGSPENLEKALAILKGCTDTITQQRFRTNIMNLGKEGAKAVLEAYNQVNTPEGNIMFGWPYMDATSAPLPGDLISFVGRPASGKTFLGLKTALNNWMKGRRVMFVSMEMNPLAIAQRVTAMYSHMNLTQLTSSGFSSQSYDNFVKSMLTMGTEEGEFYVLNGNLAATVDDVYTLADQLQVDMLVIDGAYLMKHKNPRLDRFTKVAENCESMKQNTEIAQIPTFASWQLSREAAKKMKKDEQVGLEDIGMTDAIPQASSIVLGLFQEETVETIVGRLIDVMKGRGGQVGQFRIHWDFNKMNFDEINDKETEQEDTEKTSSYM